MRADGFDVEVEHRVKGSPERVFEYFTDPAKHRRWMGVDAELDARPGGIYRIAMAPEVWVRGEYLVVDPPDRLLLTWGWESEIELPTGFRQVPPGLSAVEFRFVADGDGTVIRVRHLGLPSGEAQWAHDLGWNTYLPRLVDVTEGKGPGEDPLTELATLFYAREREVAANSDEL